MCQNGLKYPTVHKVYILKSKEAGEGNIGVWCLQCTSDVVPGTSHGISFNSHENIMRQIVLPSSFYRKGNKLREGKEFVQGHTTSK